MDQAGLVELGYEANVAFCQDMRLCKLRSVTRQLIILGTQTQDILQLMSCNIGAHNLAHYFDENGEVAVISRKWPPAGTVLYNLEFIPSSLNHDQSNRSNVNNGQSCDHANMQCASTAEQAPLFERPGGSMVTVNVLRVYAHPRYGRENETDKL